MENRLGKKCQVSKLCIVFGVLALVAVATIVTLWTVALTGGDANGGDDVTAPWDRFRLSSALVPDHYSVTLWPRLSHDTNTGLYVFTGQSTVEFECVTETDVILIHSNKLNYTHSPTVTAAGGGAVPGIKSWWLQPQTQYLVVELDHKLSEGQTYQLYTEFTGELADDLAGFYRSEYEEGGVRKIVATSQMHPTHARKTFPCFDEPAMKAVFYITVIHPPGTVALSNGRETEIANITIDGEAVTQTKFEPTKKMSTYLLAIVVCDFASVSGADGDTLIRIWARRTAIEQGQGNYALNVTGPVLHFFQSYYNFSYPLNKSDQIALPDFYFGAMENWGLVTYRESNLLYDPLTSSSRNKESTATIIAHELAHMWFGNLVTLRWWNEVWLNEGFATYVSYLGADHAEPAWNVKDLMVLDDVHRVFAVDALTSSHPLSSEEDDIVLPEQISEQFDVVSYSKGAAVLRMLSDFLSEPVFVQGLSTYLSHFAYSNTVGNDLWRHLQTAAKANNVSLPHPVDDIMNRWVLQMGFPVVTIDTSTGNVSQTYFLLDPEPNITVSSPYKYEWLIPVRWMTSDEVQSDIWWLMEKHAVNLQMRSGGSWVLANVNVTGFYRVNYDLGNWERLIAQLQSDHQVVPVLNRAQLVDDAFNLARAQLVSTTLALRTTSYLQGETEYIPWQSALNNLHYYDLMLDRTEVYQPMQEYMKTLVTPLFFYFKKETWNWTVVPDRLTDQYNQVNAINLACRTGVTECQNLTTTWFKQWMESPLNNPIDANLRSAVYCSAVAAGDEVEWEFGWSQFKNATVASEASKLMSALACTDNKQLLQRYLSYTLNPTMIRKQDATSVITSVASNRAGQSVAWDFVRDKWEFMFTQYGVGSFSFASIISGVTARFSTAAELQQLEAFVQEHGATGFGSASLAVEQALETTRANIKWLQKNKQEILDWFSSQTGHWSTNTNTRLSRK
ncbi:aminopeptidase N-like [Solea senegalensis]|uniref:Aminopeptidase n=1 Tax=Solea senegalensis TaxID=28829 RepID=A0AAV6T159_SOLSE|nr:aminopeptidase Ey-like [Solea senegalensis]KAG7523067.1 aminopeptidase N-like [Solea senegalensis]KAG7523068.1 aminopeptidase N-like [Solea senegalensis]